MSRTPLEQIAFRERASRELLARSELIPPLPGIVVAVLALLDRGETEPEQIEERLQCEPVLVGRMLGMVNSPLFGLSREITTIKEAVMVLGFRGVRSLILASGAAKLMRRDFRCYGYDDSGLWHHALAVAAGAKALTLATGGGAQQGEEIFVAGLLHDIGKLVLASYLREAGVSIRPGTDVERTELEVIGTGHGRAGGLVARHWNLTASLQNVIEHHHGPQTEGATAVACATVRLADGVANAEEIGWLEPGGEVAGAPGEDLAAVGVDTESWRSIRTEMVAGMRIALDQMAGLGG